MPVDTGLFVPDERRVVEGKVGFVGRYDDPRKNITLLLDAVKHCITRGQNITVNLIGGKPDGSVGNIVRAKGLSDIVAFVPYLERRELAAHLQSLDVFVIPSHQEGLCIAGLEAMACGCPVVSTHCGGPQEFVQNDETGYLVDCSPETMVDAIIRIITDQDRRARLSANARRLEQACYSPAIAQEVFNRAFNATFSAAHDK